MADPASYRPAPGTIPTEPGVYTFRDADDRVIYVGKAKNLRARLANYFQPLDNLHPRTRQMVTTATHVRWTVVHTEDEALNLEYTWIKRFNPRYNVMFRDDKSYPMLAVSVREEFPRVWVYRGARRPGIRYFGPYPKAWAVRDSLEHLIRVYPVRTCTKGVFRRHEMLGRPCLLGYIDKCSAPCVGRVSAQTHRGLVDALCSVYAGHAGGMIKQLRQEMEQAAAELDFEKAAQVRDHIAAIETVAEKQAIVLPQGTDCDLIATACDDLEVAVQLFRVRDGRIHGQQSWVVDRSGGEEMGDIIRSFLVQHYGDEAHRAAEDENLRAPVPPEILVDTQPAEPAEILRYLTQLRNGAGVDVRVPQRGDKRSLMETVARNAAEALHQHKLKRTGDLTARTTALADLQEALDLDQPPLRIECTDISHLAGTDVVASLVVFEDGLPKKSDYRRYQVKEAAGDGHSDDVASIKEIVRRRFSRYLKDKHHVPEDSGEDSPEDTLDLNEDLADPGAHRRFAYTPQLFLVDGGAPQVNAAQEVLDDMGITDIALAGIAKRLEELWLPGQEDPVILPRRSEALYLVQRVRDEAHRVAITYQRSKRTPRLRASALDEIAGLGPSRKKDLLAAFGSVAKIKEADVEQLQEVRGVGPALAQQIYSHFHEAGLH